MKFFCIFLILFLLNSCSFDKNSGIWQNENNPSLNQDDLIFKDFKKVSSTSETFNEIIPIDSKIKLNINKPFQNNLWTDIFYNQSNNLINFKYSNLNQLNFKSKKLTKSKVNDYILFEKNNLILSDIKGNLIVYSVKNNSIKSNFNFYKKKYKKTKKLLNLIVEKNIIYVSDNIGYAYAYNYETNKMLWAKNYKIPFRSNIKLLSDKVILANQNNDLFIIDKLTGVLNKKIPSEETIINNSFVNNISLNKNEIFFLNTYGSLYSINNKNLRFNWFINLNKTLNLDLSNLFFGSELVNFNGKILVSSDQHFYIINSLTGTILSKKNFSLISKPIISNNIIFLVTKNNLLIAIDADKGKIIYSYDVRKKIAEFINSKKNKLEINNLMLVENKLFIFLKSSYVVQFNLSGDIENINKLPHFIATQPIFIDNSLLYLDKKNRLIVVN